MNRILLMLFTVGIFHSLSAQKIFTEDDLMAVVKKYHPVAKQASLGVRIADAYVTASRGGFDPLIGFDNNRKDYDGITYYNQQWTELKIPTWYGVDIYAGAETAKGNRVNPEETKGRINYIGVSVPLVQNVLIDKRRAALQQAKIFLEQSAVVRQAILNDLMADALQTYWDWWEQHQTLLLVQATLKNAQTRFAMVKTMHRLGDRPAIDTLEAATQVQMFEQKETEALMNMQKSRLALSTFLWSEKEVAYDLPSDAVPVESGNESSLELDALLSAAKLHPILVEYDYKLRDLGIERRLKFQSLLPQVYAKYNGINKEFSKTFNEGFFQNNYRFGLSMSMPLRLSEGRGEYKAARLKIEQTELEQLSKQVVVQNKVKQYYITWLQTARQQNQQQRLVANYTALQRGEEIRFSNGESSLFLINARELKTIEGQQKLIELSSKIQQAIVSVKWSAGLL